ncbi:glutaminase A [Anaerosphaera multitolerans]|uniref:Glutaminase n=2 Tax=Anaerosphaera multitolerans TaxID=2487351 RepID=A0A437S8I5_9FIRM|nr:glutaminase A [Anaerosphaera multitolerans]RVU55158.1 glutaminase A [Anaerosphaera multitolerans]
MDLVEIEQKLKAAVKDSEFLKKEGEVASYIPELENVDKDNFGMALTTVKGQTLAFGDEKIKFSIQSISKVINLIMALEDFGPEKVFSKVGTEATAYKFNSLIPIDEKVVNPFINAGAITTASLIKGGDVEERFNRVLAKVRELSGSEDVIFLEEVYNSEMKTTDRNRSIAYYLKSKEIIEGDSEEILDLYVRNCSIGLNVRQLSEIGGVLANGGRSLKDGRQLIDKNVVKTTLSLMSTCGMYEESGRYSIEVGFPSKSGVGGAIIGIVPGKCGVCTYSPRLDKFGNSVRGKKVLAEISETLNLNMFIGGNNGNF